MMLKRLVAGLVAALSVATLGGQALAQRGATVVLIDRQTVITESEAFKSITAQLTTVRDQAQNALQQRESSLQQGLQSLQATRETLSKEDFQQRAAALTNQELDLLVDQEIANRELTVAQNNALAQLEDPLNQAVEAVAKKRKGAVVIDSAMVVYAGGAPDVTQDVLKQLNKTIASIQVVKPTTSAEERTQIRQQLEQQIALQQMEAVGRRQVLALGQQSIQAAAQQ
ncbi:MAG: OmpH family outer membrane protein [Pseudomonadota bacterium]